jgi:hypothetical protein
MDLDVFSAGFFDKKVGIDVRTCISYIKLEPFLRFGPVSLIFDVLFTAKCQKKGFSNQFDAQNAGKLPEKASQGRRAGNTYTGHARDTRLGIHDCRVGDGQREPEVRARYTKEDASSSVAKTKTASVLVTSTRTTGGSISLFNQIFNKFRQYKSRSM